jgi:prepilin-type processing-associated H-X9-DG protein
MDGAAALGMADKLIQQFAPPDFQQRWPQIRQASGLTDLQHVVFTEGFEHRNWVMQSLVEAPAPRQGLLAMGDTGPLADELLQRIPQTSTMVQAGSFDLNGLYGFVQQLFEQFSPDGGAQFHQAMQQANLMLGMDIRTDFLAAFGTQWAAYVDPATEGEGVLGMVLINRPADPRQLTQSLHRIETLANGLLQQTIGSKVHLEFRRETIGQTEISYLASPVFSPTWAINDGTLYMGLYPQVVAGALNRPAGAKSITGNQAFMHVHAELLAPKQVNAIAFNDLPRTVPEGYQSVLMVSRVYLGMGDLFGAQVPALALPTLAQLMPEIEPSGAAEWADAAGLHAKSVTPFPGAGLLGAGNMGGIGAGESALMASVLLPSLNRARETANRVKCANNLKQIGLACALYANDNRGKYPPDLGMLIKTEDITPAVFICPSANTALPGNLSGDAAAAWVNANSDYIYLGAGLTNAASADTVVAYDKDGDHGGDGINLLFADGHVEFNTMPQAHAEIDATKHARGL